MFWRHGIFENWLSGAGPCPSVWTKGEYSFFTPQNSRDFTSVYIIYNILIYKGPFEGIPLLNYHLIGKRYSLLLSNCRKNRRAQNGKAMAPQRFFSGKRTSQRIIIRLNRNWITSAFMADFPGSYVSLPDKPITENHFWLVLNPHPVAFSREHGHPSSSWLLTTKHSPDFDCCVAIPHPNEPFQVFPSQAASSPRQEARRGPSKMGNAIRG